jgi:hypothetical protein
MSGIKPLNMLADLVPMAANFIPGVGPLVAGGIGAAEGALGLGDYSGGAKGALTGFASGFGAGEAGLGDMTAGAGGLAGLGSGAGNAASIPGLLQGISSLGANNAYQNSVNSYNNRVNAGPGDPMSTMSPAEQAAYRGASDQNISQLTDRREAQLVGDLGSRGLLSSGVSANNFTALRNWQDNQRAASEASMYQAGQQRAMSIWDSQLQAAQFGVGQLGGIAGAQQKAFGTAGYNAGAGAKPGGSAAPAGGTPPIVQNNPASIWNSAGVTPPGAGGWGADGPAIGNAPGTDAFTFGLPGAGSGIFGGGAGNTNTLNSGYYGDSSGGWTGAGSEGSGWLPDSSGWGFPSGGASDMYSSIMGGG